MLMGNPDKKEAESVAVAIDRDKGANIWNGLWTVDHLLTRGQALNGLKLQDEVEAEMRRLKLELKQTMDMYSTACKEALTAKQKARELHLWKLEEEKRLEEARLAEEAALADAEKEKAKCKAALEAAEAARRLAQLEAQKRVSAEMKALKDAEERKKVISALTPKDIRYRRYSIEAIEEATGYFWASRKIGEGGYGPVYMCELDHAPVAIKVLRPDAAQGEAQFHGQEVLLLGACPEYGCLHYPLAVLLKVGAFISLQMRHIMDA